MIAGQDKSRPYGALAALIKDHLYALKGGNIYTTPWLQTPATIRRTVSILITAPGRLLELRVGKNVTKHEAVVVKPLVKRGLRAENARLVTFLVDATHPQFPAFRTIPSAGFTSLPRDIYLPFEQPLDDAYHGKLGAEAAHALHSNIVEATVKCLPPTAPVDPRVHQIVALLRRNPNCRLNDLAKAVGVSASRMSHIFTDSMGFSLRSYILWFKMYVAMDMIQTQPRVTDAALRAGFVDLAHFSREFQRAFGASVSYFRDTERVQIFHYRPYGHALESYAAPDDTATKP